MDVLERVHFDRDGSENGLIIIFKFVSTVLFKWSLKGLNPVP